MISFYVKLLIVKQTDKQTNKDQSLHNLFGGGIDQQSSQTNTSAAQ